ncbi:metal-dependent amidase/aminoacylase/carboxypeptidase [Pleomassaria siparia CBS 279.74]|uniref:Metal-dependent amidase/aminoacylase/carboxypeptidase n=1 Tax=Pleomassaria siparia CBS 279.74 TaxID=1314801 RepID=A0A6G1K9P8_9PLEO|nr:metal-dependent amidase/aminoacylase/carboxypeptidase [Pleomassaria siparia CBS 279.74]
MAPSIIASILDAHRPDLAPYEDIYKHLHAHPELSFQESHTASKILAHLTSSSFLASSPYTVVPDIGGHGVGAYMHNGAGPTVLLRADMDGLPVLETTGLAYASRVRMTDEDGVEKSVMHACGHDMHVTALLAAADTLARSREFWRGTLVLVFQPAEERACGARVMVDDGLYEKVPRPDVAIGAHVTPYRAGVIGTRRGVAASAADSFHLTLHGRQAHASTPHASIDPIILSSSLILRLQTIVSREVNPSNFAVLTVGAIHAGDRENIIPDSASLRINVRSQDLETREKVLSSMRRIITAECAAAGVEKDYVLTPTTNFPLLVNDEAVTAAIEDTFSSIFELGKTGYNKHMPIMSMSEDFGILASSIGIPSCFFLYGGTEPEVWDELAVQGRTGEIAGNHSGGFQVDIRKTLITGVDGYVGAALTFLMARGKENLVKGKI